MPAVSPEPQVALPIDAARRGEPEAWDALVRRYQLPLFTYVMDLVHHHATSLDLVQETLVRATRHLPALREDGRFGSWLFGIAHQLVIRHWRRLGRSPFSEEPIPEEGAGIEVAPDLELVREEEAAALLAAVDALPAPQRSVILLHYLEEFPLDEIAEITGTRVGTVKSRLHYAKRALRESLAGVLSPRKP